MSRNPHRGLGYRDPAADVLDPRQPSRIAAPDSDSAARLGRNGRQDGGADGVCLTDECIAKLAQAIVDAQQVAKRGQMVRGPSACVQPSSGDDFDQFLIGSTTAIPDLVGDLETLLTVRAAPNEIVTVKGFGLGIVHDTTPGNRLDPFRVFEFSIFRGGAPVDPYIGLRFSPGFGVQALAACTVEAVRGQTVSLVLRRHTAGGAGFAVSARWKGWRYVPVGGDSDSRIVDRAAY